MDGPISDIHMWMDTHEGLLAADGAAPEETFPLDIAGLRRHVARMEEEMDDRIIRKGKFKIGPHTYRFTETAIPEPEYNPDRTAEINDRYLFHLEQEIASLTDKEWERLKKSRP